MKHCESGIYEEYFSDQVRWQSWLDVEAALAEVQAELGIIPSWAAVTIVKKANISQFDIDELRREINETQTTVFALTRLFSNLCGPAGDFVHWGATTQNIIDTGRLIVLKNYQRNLSEVLCEIIHKLSRQASEYSNTLMVGRTQLCHALPITYGFKISAWIENFIDIKEQFFEIEKRLFRLRFGGAVGGFHSFHPHGENLINALADRLELRIGIVHGRSSPESFLEYLSKLTLIGQTVGKIVNELYFLTSTEISEIREYLPDSVVGSSTMPHKINPKNLIKLRSKSNKLRQLLSGVVSFQNPLNEGDASSNNEISSMIHSICPLALNILFKFSDILNAVVPDKVRMKENVLNTQEFTSSEAIQMHLAKYLGRGKAHDLINDLIKVSEKNDQSFIELLNTDPEVSKYINKNKLNELISAANNIGDCQGIAERAGKFGLSKSSL